MDIRGKLAIPGLNSKLVAGFFLSISFIGIAILLASRYGNEIATHKGLLGTRASLISDLNLVIQFVLLAGLSLGVYLARRGHYKAHQYMQTSMVLLNLVLVLWVMVGSFISNVAPGLPQNLKTVFGFVSVFHAIIGFLAIACSTYLILRMNKLLPKRLWNKHWKRLMRITFGLYWTVGILGLVLYYVWYIL